MGGILTTDYNNVGQLLGRQFKFESKNYPDEFWRHKDYKLWREPYESGNLYQLDTSFDIVPGLYGTGISFRSVNYPDHFIRHYCGECFIAKPTESDDIELFKKDASWIPREGIADHRGVSFESVNYPGEYMRHFNAGIRKDHNDASEIFTEDATWYPRLLKSPKVSGEWKLVYGNDNAVTSGQYTVSVEVGTEILEKKSTTTNVTLSWKSSLESSMGEKFSAEGLASTSASVKVLFETNLSASVSQLDSSAWKVSTDKKETYTIFLKVGEPVYLWQWYLSAVSTDSTYIMVKTNIYKETDTHQCPPPLTA